MAVVFGLAHAPGYVLRGAHAMEGLATAPDALTAAAYSIVVVSPIGFMFGVLWSRTRSLLLLAVLHGWTDLFPNLADFLKTWGMA
jgi:membrane protease YdiL (CAAX protease family)